MRIQEEITEWEGITDVGKNHKVVRNSNWEELPESGEMHEWEEITDPAKVKDSLPFLHFRRLRNFLPLVHFPTLRDFPAACEFLHGFLPPEIPLQVCNSVAHGVLLADGILLQTCNFLAACGFQVPGMPGTFFLFKCLPSELLKSSSFPAKLHWSWLSSFCPHLEFMLPTRPHGQLSPSMYTQSICERCCIRI